MADAIIYYRNGYSQAPDQMTIAQLPSAQKVEFTFPDNTLETLHLSYMNNVIDIPVPIGDGTRKINKQENGLKAVQVVIQGRFKKPTSGTDADIGRLISMSKRVQIDDVYPFGNIGLYSPNAPEFTLDPNADHPSTPATKGFTISSWDLSYSGVKTKSYNFSLTLNFGGTW